MKRTTQPGFHRHVFSEAWRIVWQRPHLWLLAVFAGATMSGAVVEPVLGSFLRVNQLAELFDGTHVLSLSAWVERMGPLIQSFCRVDQTQLQLWMFAVTLLTIIGVTFTVWTQTGLIAGLVSKESSTLSEALHRGAEHIWTLFIANAAARAVQAILSIAIGLPVVLYLVRPGIWETFAASLAVVLGLGLSSFAWMVALMSSIRAVQKEEPAHTALAWAFRLGKEQPLLLLETGLLLGGASLLALAAFVIASVLASLLLGILWVALGSGTWLPGAAFVGALGTVGFSLLFLGGWGMLTTFRYAIWVRVYDRLSNHLVRRATIAKTHRLFHPKHIR